MIQRIQTLFLLSAFALLFSMFFSNMASSGQETVQFNQVLPLLIINIVTCFLAFISVFLYRHRMIQIRISVLNSIILVGYQAWVLWLFFARPEGSAFTISSVFPIVAAILTFTALRYIARDEAMVRSTSRLRK